MGNERQTLEDDVPPASDDRPETVRRRFQDLQATGFIDAVNQRKLHSSDDAREAIRRAAVDALYQKNLARRLYHRALSALGLE